MKRLFFLKFYPLWRKVPIIAHHTKNSFFKSISFSKADIFSYSKLMFLPFLTTLTDENKIKVTNYLQKSFDLLNHNEINRSVVPLILAISYYPEIGKAISLIELGELEQGIAKIENIFIHDLNLEDAYLILKGIIYCSLDLNKEAGDCFNRAIKIARNDKLRSCAHYYNSKLLEKTNFKLSRIELQKANSLDKKVTKFSLDFKSVADVVKCYLPHPEFNNKNRVIIRVWLPDSFFSKSFGHVSLETEKNYMSFWPGNMLVDYFEDIKNMAKLPEIRLTLYQLDAKKISNAFEEFKKSKFNWSIWGSGLFRSEKSRSCAGLTYFLLQEGGLKKLRTYYWDGIWDLTKGYLAAAIGVGSVGLGGFYGFTLLILNGMIGLLKFLNFFQEIAAQFSSSVRRPENVDYFWNEQFLALIGFLLVSGALEILYAVTKIATGTYKVTQKLLLTTPENIITLTENSIKIEKKNEVITNNRYGFLTNQSLSIYDSTQNTLSFGNKR